MATITVKSWDITCHICKILRTALVTFAMGVWAFGESAGRARAAEALWREGFHEEAKRLMLENR
jgi:hypothetical protein